MSEDRKQDWERLVNRVEIIRTMVLKAQDDLYTCASLVPDDHSNRRYLRATCNHASVDLQTGLDSVSELLSALYEQPYRGD